MADLPFIIAQQGYSAPGPMETPLPRGPNALEIAGAGLGDAAAQLKRARDAKEEMAMQRILAEAREDWNGRFVKAQSEAPAGAPDFAKTFIGGFDADIAQRGQGLSKDRQEELRARAAALRANLSTGATEFEIKSSNEKMAADFGKVASLSINGVRSNPAKYEAAISELEAGIGALPLGGAVKDKLRTDYRQKAAVASVEGVADRNPVQALKLLNDGVYDADLSPEKKGALVNAVEAEQRRREAEARREAREQQVIAVAQAQGLLQDQIAAIRETGRGVVSDQEFADTIRKAFPKVADRYVRAAQDEQQFFNVRTSVALTSRDEDAKALADAAPKVDPTSPTGLYNDQVRRRDQLARALREKWEAVANDPAAYALRSPNVQAMFRPNVPADATDEQKAAAVTAATVSGTRALLETQAHLGVPDHARRVLTKDQAESTVARLTAAGDEERANILAGLRRQYGEDFWPIVQRDLQAAKMPPELTVLSRLDLGRDASARVDLSAAFKVGRTALEKDIPETDRRAVKDRLAELYAPMRGAMFAQGGAAAEVFGSERDAAYVMALHRMAKYGEDPGTAAKNVHKLLIDDKMEFRGAISAPKGQARDVVKGLGVFQDALTPEALAPMKSTRPGITLADRQKETAYYAQRGTFINNERGDGYILRMPNGADARWADGSRVEISRADALKLADGNRDAVPEMVKRQPMFRATPDKIVGLVEQGNIDLNTRPSVTNPDGSVSSVRSMSVNIEGKEVLIPTVSEDGRIMSEDEAVAQYEKTGRHLGIFDTPQHATAYAEILHREQEARTKKPAPGLNLTVPGMDTPPRFEGGRR